MAENITVRFDAEGQRAVQQAMEGIQGAARSMGETMTRVGRNLTVGVTLPMAAVGGAAAKLAADAQEAANKFEVVMGPAAREVRAELEQLTETIPLTRSQMEQMAAGIQDMLVPMGVARQQAAEMSAEMIRLGGDIASFNNVASERVLEAFQSGLAGMSRPLRQFGIDARQSRLEAIALEEGLVEAGEAMDETARAQALMVAIQRDSQDAIGDSERTMDEFTNALRFLRRDVRQLGEDLGEVLVPALRPLVNAARRATEWLGSLDDSTKTMIVALGGLAAAAGPVILGLGQLANIFSALVGLAPIVVSALAGIRTAALALQASLGPVGWLSAGIGAVATAWLGWKGASAVAGNALDGLKGKLEDLRTEMEETELQANNLAEQIGEGVTVTVETTSTAVSGVFSDLRDRLSEIADLALALGDHFDATSERIRATKDAIRSLLDEGIGPMSEQVQRLRRQLDALTGAPEMGVAGRAVAGGGQAVAGTLQGPVSDVLDVDAAIEAMRNLGDEGEKNFANAADTAITSLGAMAEAAVRGTEQMEVTVVRTFTSIMQSLTRKDGPLEGLLGGLGGAIFGAVGGILTAALSGGRDRPQPVRMEEYSSRAQQQMRQNTGPDTVQVRILDAQGNVRSTVRSIRELEARDSVVRLPDG